MDPKCAAAKECKKWCEVIDDDAPMHRFGSHCFSYHHFCQHCYPEELIPSHRHGTGTNFRIPVHRLQLSFLAYTTIRKPCWVVALIYLELTAQWVDAHNRLGWYSRLDDPIIRSLLSVLVALECSGELCTQSVGKHHHYSQQRQ
jgi:hypothetical protein